MCIAGVTPVSDAADHTAQEDASILAEAAEPAIAAFLKPFKHIWGHIALYKTASTQVHVDGIDLSLTSFGARDQVLNQSILRQYGNAASTSRSPASAFQQYGQADPIQQPGDLLDAHLTAHAGLKAASTAEVSPTQPATLVPEIQPASMVQQQGGIPPALQNSSAAEHRKVHRRHEQPSTQPTSPGGLAGSTRSTRAPPAKAVYLTSQEASILAAVEAGLSMTRQQHIVLRQWGLTCIIEVQPPTWLAEQSLGSASSIASAVSLHPASPDLPVSPDTQAAFALAAQDSFAITDDSKGMTGAFQAAPDRHGKRLVHVHMHQANCDKTCQDLGLLFAWLALSGERHVHQP